jgi:hypothetical protein
MIKPKTKEPLVIPLFLCFSEAVMRRTKTALPLNELIVSKLVFEISFLTYLIHYVLRKGIDFGNGFRRKMFR